MARSRKAFGPLLYGTLIVSAALLGGYGGWLGWQSVARAWQTHGLAKQMRDPNSTVRWSAAGQLAQIGEDAIPTLIAAMKDPDPKVRVMACKTFPSVDPNAETAIPALLTALKDPEPKVRRAAAVDLGWLYQSFVIQEQEKGTRWTLGVVEALRGSLHDKDERVRRVSAEALIHCGRQAAPAFPDLLDALSDRTGDVRLASAKTLIQVDPTSRARAVATILDLLTDLAIPIGTVRLSLVADLREIEPKFGSIAAPKLIRWLEDPESSRRVEAVALLNAIGPEARPAIAGLERLLKGSDLNARACSAMVLARLDPSNQERNLSALVASADDPALDPKVRTALFDTIHTVAPRREPELAPALVRAIQREKGDRRLDAIASLRQLSVDARKPAVPALVEARSDPDPRIATAAGQALSEIDPVAFQASGKNGAAVSQ